MAIRLLTMTYRASNPYGSYGDYGAYKRDEIGSPERRGPEPEPEPAPADYSKYGKYGDYGSYKDIKPAGAGNPYGSYGSYGSYKEGHLGWKGIVSKDTEGDIV